MPDPSSDQDAVSLIEINLAGEIKQDAGGSRPVFRRGVSSLPTIGDGVHLADRSILTLVYNQPDSPTLEVGTLFQNSSIPARLLIDELFGKHLLIVGSTGCGKTSALTCILQSLLPEYRYARIVVLDVHDEYAAAFGEQSESIDPSSLKLPFWLLNFRELTAAFTSSDENVEARSRFSQTLCCGRSAATAMRLRAASGDRPTVSGLPSIAGAFQACRYRLLHRRAAGKARTCVEHDALQEIEKPDRDSGDRSALRLHVWQHDGRRHDGRSSWPSLSRARGNQADHGAEAFYGSRQNNGRRHLGRVSPRFRFGLLERFAASRVDRLREAHRYAPADASGKFLPTREALARIAKEGRKYGVSLALITQRPSELDPTILSRAHDHRNASFD